MFLAKVYLMNDSIRSIEPGMACQDHSHDVHRNLRSGNRTVFATQHFAKRTPRLGHHPGGSMPVVSVGSFNSASSRCGKKPFRNISTMHLSGAEGMIVQVDQSVKGEEERTGMLQRPISCFSRRMSSMLISVASAICSSVNRPSNSRFFAASFLPAAMPSFLPSAMPSFLMIS